ncbi:MAG: hypothetical protein WBC96_08610 [Thermodesulfobacteriota bacterium]
MITRFQDLIEKNLFLIAFLIFLVQFSIIPSGLNLSDSAHAASNSSGNNVKREINTGLDLVGRSKTEVIQLIGRPKTKDKSPSKGRYNEKWTYSCEDKNGAKQNCVFLYFGADQVKKVEVN